jgi:1-acyl-sn-glycerol-3-phosphate acyltransferase
VNVPAAPIPYRDRSRLALAWYEAVRSLAVLYCRLMGGFRATGCENIPRAGGGLIASNHVSYLDVIALGLACPRPMSYVARASLFRPPLGWLIRSVGGFPIDREGSGTAGLKETLRRLRGGDLVLLFPEGTRSLDGELGPLKPGFAALARARVPIIPAAVAGTFEAWPRGRKLPRRHAIRIHFGPLIPPEEIAALSSEELVELVRQRILECQRSARSDLPGSAPPASVA